MHQLLESGAGDERPNDVGVRDVRELGALLGETPNEVSERLIRLLMVAPRVLGVSRAHVCALKIPNEDPDQVGPAVDQSLREVLEACPSQVSQV